jgi:hypothetical protein
MDLIPSVFSVRDDVMLRLSPRQAVEVFRDLLFAEAFRLHIPISKVHISTNIDVADGGIDASVDWPVTDQSGLIKTGLTSYQIKAGESFAPWREAVIKKELFGEKPAGKDNLGKSIRECFEHDGTYVLVCVKVDLVDPQRPDAERFIKAQAQACGFRRPKVEVWNRSNLIGFFQPFPSLALRLNGLEGIRGQSHKSWSQQDDMNKAFEAGPKQLRWIETLQKHLRESGEARHIRILGDAGIGKTKLILEATRVDDLRPICIYFDSASRFMDSELMNQLTREDNNFNCILVIDESDYDSMSRLWNRLKPCGPRIKIATIYNDFETAREGVNYLGVEPLSDEQIVKIVQSYGVPADHANRWANFCSGSPRVAHVIGQNLRTNAEDILQSPDTVNVWERYIVSSGDRNQPAVKERRTVLRFIALFKRFGFGRPVSAEAKAISKIVEQTDHNITWGRFQEIIKELRQQRLLQGENTLYLTPKALHIVLWIEWWETYGSMFDFEGFLAALTDSLRGWYFEMFEFARESPTANKIVEDMLGRNGPFRELKGFDSEERSRFFLALSNANPDAALRSLQSSFTGATRTQLLNLVAGRRNVVWALERIAMWKDSFSGAARLLMALGDAENERWSNNASGVFAGLFTVAPAPVSPTEASPEERFPVLLEALTSLSPARRQLGLDACNVALETRSFVRLIGPEFQGLRKQPQLWKPQSDKETVTAYRKVWKLLLDLIDNLAENERRQAASILTRHARSLSQLQSLGESIVSDLRTLIDKGILERKEVLKIAIETLKYDSTELPAIVRSKWQGLRDELTGQDFHSLLKRFVGMSLLEDLFDEGGKQIAGPPEQIVSLAHEAVANKELLLPELSWLVTEQAENGYQFGYLLGKADSELSLLSEILVAQSKTTGEKSAYFLAGYFKSVFEKDRDYWEKQLDVLVQDQYFRTLVPEITFRSGMTDRSANRILDLVMARVIPFGELRMFVYGSVLANLSEEVFLTWIDFLIDCNDRSALSIALNMLHFYYTTKGREGILPEERTGRLLKHPILFSPSGKPNINTMDEYYWTGLGIAYIRAYPGQNVGLVQMIIEHYGEDDNILGGSFSRTDKVLNLITQSHPKEVWYFVSAHLGPPIDSRAFNLSRWLRGGEHYELVEGAIQLIPQELIWMWVDQDIERRAWYLASFVPNRLFREEGKVCFAREILVRYGDRENVQNNLVSNFTTEGWSGPASLHYSTKKEGLLAFKDKETDAKVRRWIDEYVRLLTQQSDRARIEEEREDY